MPRPSGITIDRIAEAGYLSPAAREAVREKKVFSELTPDVLRALPPREREELLFLTQDAHTGERLYYLEKLDGLLASGDAMPGELLETLLEYEPSSAANNFVLSTGREAFLRECVFTVGLNLPWDKKGDVDIFVRMYENVFIRKLKKNRWRAAESVPAAAAETKTPTDVEAGAGTETAGTETEKKKKTEKKTEKETETETETAAGTETETEERYGTGFDDLPLFSQPAAAPDAGREKTPSAPERESVRIPDKDPSAGTLTVDMDAVSTGEDMKYVLFIKNLGGETEFLRRYIGENVSKETYKVLERLGLKNFLVNYLYAEKEKLSSVVWADDRTVREIGAVTESLKASVARMYESFGAGAAGRGGGVANPHGTPRETVVSGGRKTDTALREGEDGKETPETEKPVPLEKTMGAARYGLVMKKFEKLLGDAPTHTANVIRAYKGNFIEDFVRFDAAPEMMPLAGPKTAKEIKLIIDVLRREISRIKAMTEDEAAAGTMRMAWAAYGGALLDGFVREFEKERGRFPMLYIAEKFFEEKAKEENGFALLDMVWPVRRDGVPLSFAEAGKRTGRTPESARGTVEAAARKLAAGPAGYGSLLSVPSDWEYLREKMRVSDIIYAGNVRELLEDEPCNLSAEYLLCLVHVLLEGEYETVGRKFFDTGVRNRNAWTNTFLVSKALAECFDMKTFRWSVERSEMYDRTSVMTAEEMLLGDMRDAVRRRPGHLAESVREAACLVLTLEMGKEPDEKGRFTLAKKGNVLPQTAIREMLEEKGEPMTADEVLARLAEKFPGRYLTAASLIPVIRTSPDIKRERYTDKIGLAKWIKPGSVTARDIVRRYLARSGPVKTTDVIEYVRSQRPGTTDNTVRAILSFGKEFIRRGHLWTVAGPVPANNDNTEQDESDVND